jgi:hypothetical protein
MLIVIYMHIVAFICSILLYLDRRNMIENHLGGELCRA